MPTGVSKGDIAVFDGTNWVILAPGSDGQVVLTAASTQASGLEWATGSGSANWTEIINESGASLANWTPRAGSWSTDGTQISGSGSTGLLEYTGLVNIPWGGPVYITVEISSPSLNVGSDTHAGLAPTYKGNTSSNPGTPCVRLQYQSTGAAQWESMGSSARGSVAEALGTNTYYRIGMLISNGEWTATFQGSILGSASTAGPGSGSGQVAALQLYTCNVTAKFMSIHIWVPTAWRTCRSDLMRSKLASVAPPGG